MTRSFADPSDVHPIRLPDGTAYLGTVFLNAAIDHPRIDVGDYTYASAFDPPDDWAKRLAPYIFDFSPERLQIGRFCQIADSVTFITSSANHRYDGFSSYPFGIFSGGLAGRPSMPDVGLDTIIGHDVWIGQGATILPGATIGNGVIIGAGSVVGGDVPDYAIIAGNPAQILRMRFAPVTIDTLLTLAWWHWPIDQIIQSEAAIVGADLDALRQAQK